MKLELTNQFDKSLFQDLLRNNIVLFTYTKKDGTARTACGTLNMNKIPEKFHPKNRKDIPNNAMATGNNETPTQITHFDLNALSKEGKGGWRSPHLVGHQIEIHQIKPIKDMTTVNTKEKRTAEIYERLVYINERRETLKIEKRDHDKILKGKFSSLFKNVAINSVATIEIERDRLKQEKRQLKKELSELLK